MIPRIKKGQAIRAAYLNKMGTGLNDLIKAVQPPRQQNKPAPTEFTDVAASTEPDYAFIEQSRENDEVQIFDQNSENYALIKRMESVTFQNGKGEILRLVFDNIGEI